jgi:transposase
MADSIGIDSLLGEGTMPAAYSADIRGRVIASVESGSSRREAAEEFDVSASSAIKWVAAYRTTGSCAAKPRGGSTSPLEKYAKNCRLIWRVRAGIAANEMWGKIAFTFDQWRQ